MKYQPLLQRCQRIDIFQLRMLGLDQLQLRLLEPHQWEVGWCMSTCTFTLTMRYQLSQRLCKLCRHSLNRFPPMHCLAVAPVHLQLPVDYHPADRQ